ncbi:MAG: sodium-dependent transporter [Exilibacterium sp.]
MDIFILTATVCITLFIVMTLVVVMGGVGKGLGVAVRVLMPLLFLFVLALVYYGSTRGDLAAALSFLFGFSAEGFTWGSFLMALGHSFLTLGLGLGAIMAYGAYMPEKVPLGKTVVIVVCLDTLFSLLVGVAIFSVVIASPSVQLREGPSLMFISLPVIFGDMPDGRLFGTVFFMMVVVVAWSSTISLLEPMVAWLVESKQYSRIRASLLVGAAAWFVGLGTVFSFNDWAEVKTFFGANFFEFLDFLTTNIMLPLSGILIAVFVGWVMRYESLRQELRNESLAIFEGWVKVLRLASPVGMLIVLVTTLYFKLSG